MSDALRLLRQGDAEQRAGGREAAVASYRAALAADPGLLEARGRLGDLLAVLELEAGPPPPRGGDWPACDALFDKLLGSDIAAAAALVEDWSGQVPPDSLRLLLMRAAVALRCLDYDGMLATARQACAHHPDSVNALQALSRALRKRGDDAEALPVLERLVDRHHLLAMQPERALCLHRAGRPAAAVEAFHALLPIFAARPVRMITIEYGVMQALRELGDLAGARAAAGRLAAVMAVTPNSLRHFVHVLRGWEAAMPAVESKRGLTLALRQAGTTGAKVDFYPETLLLPEEADALPEVGIWIFKPENFSGGQGIRLTGRPREMAGAGSGLLQRYIEDPLLIGGLKGHLRLYLLVTCSDPLRAWFWDDGIVRFAPRPFGRDAGWLERIDMHVTNTALHLGNPLLKLSESAADGEGHVWSLDAMIAALPVDAAGQAAFRARLRDLGSSLLAAFAAAGCFRQVAPGTGFSYPPKLIGLDVVIDAELRPWLAEAQFGPAITGSPLVNQLNARVFGALRRMTLAPVLAGAATEAEIAAAEATAADRFMRLA